MLESEIIQNINLHIDKKTLNKYRISDEAIWKLLNFQYIKCHDILWVAVILFFTSWKSIYNKILIKRYKQDYKIPLYELYELSEHFNCANQSHIFFQFYHCSKNVCHV